MRKKKANKMMPLIPILINLVPSLIGLFAGDKAGDLAVQAVNVAKQLTGASNENEAAAIINSDPAKAAEVQIALAKIASEAKIAQDAQETARLQAIMGDMANARAATANPLIAKTQVGLACFVMLMFCGVLFLMGTRGVPQGTETLFNVMLGALIAAETAIIAFFFGNSTSAHSANAAMANMAQRTPVNTVIEATTESLNNAVLSRIKGK